MNGIALLIRILPCAGKRAYQPHLKFLRMLINPVVTGAIVFIYRKQR